MLPGKAPLLMRTRGTGRAVAVEDSLSLIQGCSSHQEGTGGRPGTDPGKEAVWARLGRGATGAGATVKQSRSERPHTDRSVQCCTAEFSTA